VVICEDSRTYSQALTAFLERDDELRVVGVCTSAEELFRELPRLQPDVITMDLELPGLDGVSAIEQIMSTDPQAILVISAHTPEGSERTAAALAAGALDAIHKSDVRLDEAGSETAAALRRRVKRLAQTKPYVPEGSITPPSRSKAVPVGGEARVIGIAASSGGPAALAAVLSELPAHLALPVLVVQHMSPGFTEGLVRWLDQTVPAPVRLARPGGFAGPGIWFAPDGSHLALDHALRMRAYGTAGEDPHPSGDVLLLSLAEVAGPQAVAVVLTGPGRDGAAGVAAVRAAGGLTVAQDAASAAINGMPAAAIDAGAELVLEPRKIGQLLASLRPRLEAPVTR
jgi:two-component system chemotaxis response regulator CheB